MRKVKTRPWDTAEHLKTEQDMVEFLDACLAEDGDDPAFVAHALDIIKRAHSMATVVEQASAMY